MPQQASGERTPAGIVLPVDRDRAFHLASGGVVPHAGTPLIPAPVGHAGTPPIPVPVGGIGEEWVALADTLLVEARREQERVL